MTHSETRVAVIGGYSKGSDFSESLVQRFLAQGYTVAVLLRNPANHQPGEAVEMFAGDLTHTAGVEANLQAIEDRLGPIEVYIHNAATLVRGKFTDCEPEGFENAWRGSVLSAVTVCSALVPHMLKRKRGTIILTGATASIRGGAGFSPFASAKFALRGLGQSLARELGPQGIHVVHTIVDGLITGYKAQEVFKANPDVCIDAGHMADVYMNLIHQPRSCWTQELDMRPSVESF